MDDAGGRTAAQPGRSRRRWILGVVFLLLAVFGVAYALFRLSLHREVQKRFEAIRAAGYPVTLEELNGWCPDEPEGENAAAIYQKAFDLLEVALDSNPAPDEEAPDETQSEGEGESDDLAVEDLPIFEWAQLRGDGDPLSPEELQRIRAHVERNEDALLLLRKAAVFGACRWPVDWREGPLVEMPHISGLHRAYRLLTLEMVLRLEDGQVDRALRSVDAILRASKTLRDDAICVSQLLRFLLCTGAVHGLERICTRVPLSREDAARLANLLAECEDPDSFTRGMVGERCLGIWAAGRPAGELEGMRPGPVPWLEGFLRSATGHRERDTIFLLDTMEGYIALTESPYPDRLRIAAELDGRVNAVWGESPSIYRISGLFLPSMRQVVERDIRWTALCRAARMGLCVESYRGFDGRLPEALADLVPSNAPAVLADPYDGAPLRYRRLEKGFVVYSIGPDLKDDGGGSEWDPRTKSGDITFSIER